MKTLAEIIMQPEGRKLEFKEMLPTKADLAKTILAFANDAGGEFYLGIKNNPREIIGINEADLISMEEKITNIIHDQCYPVILPEVTFLNFDGRHLIKLQIFKGSNPPYYLKHKGAEEGTYVRVGSSNRQASPEIIAELKRQQHGKSYDSELTYDNAVDILEFKNFRSVFQEKTGESLDMTILKKLELVRSFQNTLYPTNALILLSDDDLKNHLFAYAKIECARFKGESPGNFIDQKTFNGSILTQPDQAYQFVLTRLARETL